VNSPFWHGNLYRTPLPLLRQDLRQLDSSLRTRPCSGVHCRWSRAGRCNVATLILLDDQSLWMAHVVSPRSYRHRCAVALLWLWYVRDHPSQHPSMIHQGPRVRSEARLDLQARKEPTPWRRLFSNRSLVLLTAGYFAVSYFEYIYFFWIYYYLGEIRHLGHSQTVAATTTVFLTWMVMSPLAGWVSDSLARRLGKEVGRRLIPIVGLMLGALLLCIGINVTGTLATVTLLSLPFGFASCSDGPYWACAAVADRRPGAETRNSRLRIRERGVGSK
jgi:sugar phosphate permease